MTVNPRHKAEHKPPVQIFYLMVFALLGLILFGFLGIALVYAIYGMKGVSALTSNTFSMIGGTKIVLTAQQLGLFLTPALLLAWFEKRKINSFYGLSTPRVNLLMLTAILSICWMPLISLTNEWNQALNLPDSLKSIEQWMRDAEDSAAITTQAILKMNSVSDLLLNLLVIAAVPAICEEFVFRGALLRTVFRSNNNPHLAIWLAAIIFSTIHFQFFGFIPRMLLGAAFGYIYFYTGSIWYAVFAHFLNNGYVVCVAFYLQSKNLPYDNSEDLSFVWYGYFISVILTLLLFYYLKQRATVEQPIYNPFRLKKNQTTINEN